MKGHTYVHMCVPCIFMHSCSRTMSIRKMWAFWIRVYMYVYVCTCVGVDLLNIFVYVCVYVYMHCGIMKNFMAIAVSVRA
jgi:hypothetical protein